MHQTTWQSRSLPGAFANPFFTRFHTHLISQLLPRGGVQLLRLTAGDQTVGCLYNLVKDDIVYAYQSGFHYPKDARLKPGYVSHYLAIEENLRRGAARYCFMAGNARYKQSLGTNVEDMTWLTIRPNQPLFRIENALREKRRWLYKQLRRSPRKDAI